MDGYFLLLCMVMCVVFLTKNNKIGPLHDEPLKTMKLFFWLFFFSFNPSISKNELQVSLYHKT